MVRFFLMTSFYIVRTDQLVVGVYSLQSNHVSIVPLCPPHLILRLFLLRLVQTIILFYALIYIPPDSPVCHISSLVLYLTGLVSSFNRCIFVCNFNFPHINWSSLIGSSISSNTFCEFIFDCNLTQHVTQPTHTKGNTSEVDGDPCPERICLGRLDSQRHHRRGLPGVDCYVCYG